MDRGASWAEVIDAHAEWAPHGFLIYWRSDVHPVMQLAGDENDCLAYLMGNVTIAEQMFRHDPRAMLYAPLRTVIWEDARNARGSRSTSRARSSAASGYPGSRRSGVELDRKLAALLEALRVEVPMALLSSTATA